MSKCSCASSSSSSVRPTVNKKSTIKIITCDSPKPDPEDCGQHIIVQEGNDIPLTVRLVYGEQDERFPLDVKDVVDLEVLVTNYLTDVKYYYVVTDPTMIDFTLYARYLPAGKHTIRIKGVWRGHEIKYTYDDVLHVLPKDPRNCFTKHVYKRGELMLDNAVFIPSIQEDIQELQRQYTEATDDAREQAEAARLEYEHSKEVSELYVEKYIPEIYDAVKQGGGGGGCHCDCKADITFIKNEITNNTYGLQAIEQKIEEIIVGQEPEAMTNEEIDEIIARTENNETITIS